MKAMDATISVKTVKFNKNAIKNLGALKSAMQKQSQKGYCKKVVPSMAQVSNKKLCGGVNRNVGYYYKVSFPVGQNGTEYSFRLPTDFGLGGVSMLDGKIMKQESKDIWSSGRATNLNFAITLNAGQHVLEVYGAEGCCDGTTKWQFAVNKGTWMEFTSVNLNRFYKKNIMHTADTTMCKKMKGYAKLCPGKSGYHYTITKS